MNKSAVALIGPSGSGKSSIGLSLARLLRWQFLDTDSEIERILGLSVSEIFQNLGESEFRNQESRLVENLTGRTDRNLILAAGGGLPVHDNNWERLESFASIVYLTAPLEVLVTRIKHSQNRPLLQRIGSGALNAPETDLENRLGKLIAERERFYNRARYKIDTVESDVEKLANDIIRLIGLVLPPDS